MRGSVKLHFKITCKLIPLKLHLFSVLLTMDMNRYILHIKKHILHITVQCSTAIELLM
jgi:hypothetical protein